MSNEPVAWMSSAALFRHSETDEVFRSVATPLYTHPVDDTALLRQCVEALREARAVDCDCPWLDHWNDAITALRERLGEKT